jgi:hypothetical protein
MSFLMFISWQPIDQDAWRSPGAPRQVSPGGIFAG